MTLKAQLFDDMKSAMRAGDKSRLGVIRLMQAAIKQREVDERIELDDAAVLSVFEKMLKQRRDSVTQFKAAGRDDLVAIEELEIEVIRAYLPEPLDEQALLALIVAGIAESGASGPQDLGKVVAYVKSHAAGRADMGKVAALAKQKLS